jgi:hypothetical protein
MDHRASSTHGKMVEKVWERWWTLWYVVDDGLQPWSISCTTKKQFKKHRKGSMELYYKVCNIEL